MSTEKPSMLFDVIIYRVSKFPLIKPYLSHELTTNAYKAVKCPAPSDILVPMELGSSHVSRVTEYLYLGDVCAAHSLATMRRHGITTIVNMCLNCPDALDTLIETKRFGIRDAVDEDLTRVLEPAIQYIEGKIRAGGRVFLHCKAGVSRSGAIAVGYIMYKNQWSYAQALSYVQSVRAVVQPNEGFVKTLQKHS